MKCKLIPSFLLIIFTIQLCSAATVTWNGGNGFWGQASRWDTGQVPGSDDDVIIPSGFVLMGNSISTALNTLTINANAILWIDNNAQLAIGNKTGIIPITNHGAVHQEGEVTILNISTNFPGSLNDHGIKNLGFYRIRNSGKLNLINIAGRGIHNYPSGNFIVEGSISCLLQSAYWHTAISNSGRFENRLQGIITIHSSQYGINTSVNAIFFKNRGKITIKNTYGAGLINYNTLENFSTGTITLYKSSLTNSATFINHGNVNMNKCGTYFCRSSFENHGYMSIRNSTTVGIQFIHNGANTPFDNFGYLSIKDSNSHSMDQTSASVFHNHAEGYVEVDNHLGSLTLINDGIFKSSHEGNHLCVLTNNGIFGDEFGSLPSSALNNKIIVHPIDGPLFSGQSVSPAMSITNSSGVNFGDWIDNMSYSQVCGSFTPSTETLVPNSYAEHQQLIHVHLELSNGNSDWFNVRVESSSNSIKHENNQLSSIDDFLPLEKKSNIRAIDQMQIEVYPNPARNYIKINMPTYASDCKEIIIRNSDGKLIYKTNLNSNEDQVLTLDIPSFIPNGAYLLEVVSESNERFIEQLIIVN